MAKKNESQELKRTLAESINEVGLGSGANADEVINTWSARAREAVANPAASLQQLVPVIQSFTGKIAEMDFYERRSAYNGEFKEAINRMYDRDLIYGFGREANLPGFIPVSPMNADTFVPTSRTAPINTTSVIQIDEPIQVNLTLQPELYRTVVNKGGNLSRFVETLKGTMTKSLETYLDNKIIEGYLLAQTANNATGNLTFSNNGAGTVSVNNKTSKYTDSASRNMKEAFNVISWLINKMCQSATNLFNLGGTSSNAFQNSDMDSIKIFCTNKFYQNVMWGIQLGLFKPELLNPIISKLTPLPDHKLVLPTASNTAPTNAQWTNQLNDNTLLIVNVDHSFKFGKQFQNTSSQYFAKNMAIEITTNYLPYFGYLKDGQALVYTCGNLNTLPANAMQNIG